MRQFAAPDVIADLEPVGVLGDDFNVGWDDMRCSLGSSGAGGCDVLVFFTDGPCCAFIYLVSYHEEGQRTVIDGILPQGDAG
jgi:hypothetical protein